MLLWISDSRSGTISPDALNKFEAMTITEAEGTMLDVFVEPRAYVVAFVRRSRWGLGAAMIALFFALTATSTIVVLQDKDLVVDYTENVVRKPPEGISRERLEEIRQNTRTALELPGMTIVVGLVTGASTVLHLMVTWVVIAFGVALAMKASTAFGRAFLAEVASVPILMLGTAVNLLLRIGFHDLTAVAGILPAVGLCGAAAVACSLAASVDVFVVWYLTVVAFGISASTPMRVWQASLLVFALWGTVLVCSFLLGRGAGWTM